MGLTADELAAWVERSCEAQGLAVRVRDPTTIEKVRILLGGAPAEARAPARSASTGSAGARSTTSTPDRHDPDSPNGLR